MPGNKRIESIIDSQTTGAELKALIAGLKEADTLIKSMGQVKLDYKGASSIQEQKKSTDELVKSNEKMLELQKQLEISAKKLAEAEALLSSEKEKTSRTNKQRTDDEIRASVQQREETKRRTDAIRAEQDAYKQLTLQYNQAAAAAKKLSAEALTDPSKMKAAEAAAQRAKTMWDQLKSIDAGVGQHFKNVGNYTAAMGTLEKGLQDISQKMDALTKSGQGNSQEMEKLQREHELLNQVLNRQTKGFTSLTMEVRANEKALATMFAEGMQGTEAYKQLELQLSKAKRELGEFKEQQKLLSSQTPAISAAMVAAKGLAGAYAVGAGAAALFGDQEGKIQKEMEKLVAIMTVLQGLQEVHELLEKKGTIAKIASAAATGIQTAAQRIWSATMLQSITTTVAFRIALIALTSGLLLLVPLIAFGFGKMTDAKKKDAEATQDLEEKHKLLNEVLIKSADKVGEVVTTVNDLKEKIKLAKEGILDKKKVLEDYNEKLAGTVGHTNDLNVAEKTLIEHGDEIIQLTFLKAKAQAAAALASEAAAKAVEAEAKSSSDFVSNMDAVGSVFNNFWDNVNPFQDQAKTIAKQTEGLLKQGEKTKKEEIKQQEDKYKTLSDLQKQFTDEAALYAKEHKLNFYDSKDGKKSDNQTEKDLKAEFEAEKAHMERLAELYKMTADDEKVSYQERIMALGQYIRVRQELIEKVADQELKIGKKSAKEKIAIRKKADDDEIKIALEGGIELAKMQEAHLKALGDQELKATDSVQKALHEKLGEYLKKRQEDEAKAVEKSEEELQQKRMKALETYSQKAKEVSELIAGFFQISIDKQKNQLQDKEDLINKNYETEVQNITNSTLSEEQKAARLKILEQQKLAQTEQIERRKRQLDMERARFDKAANIASIILDTALAVVRALGDKTLPGPARLALAITTGVIGAAQLAKAIATPIPKFKKGTDSSPEGWAETDEEGAELYIPPTGKPFFGNDQPTLRYLQKGTKIIPHDEVNRMLLHHMMAKTSAMFNMPDKSSSEISKLRQDLKENTIWQTAQLKDAYKNSKQQININISDFKNSDYIKKAVRE